MRKLHQPRGRSVYVEIKHAAWIVARAKVNEVVKLLQEDSRVWGSTLSVIR